MKTEGLKKALDLYNFDVAFGGKGVMKKNLDQRNAYFHLEQVVICGIRKIKDQSFWKLFNCRKNKEESIRVFPLSNWTELDIWLYIYREKIPIVPLYYASERPIVRRDGMLIMVDDDRFKFRKNEIIEIKKVRFRTLGCYPLVNGSHRI